MLAPGLTDQQLECLWVLNDGNWHDHREIGMHIKKFIPSNLSGRIIGPLEKRGLIEQEERPIKDGSRKMKKFVRVRKDLGKQSLHDLHLLIEYSANDLLMRYRKKDPERKNFFSTMRDESIKKLSELKKLEEKKQQREEAEYWAKRLQKMDAESWQKLVAVEKEIYEELKLGCRDCCERGYCRQTDCYPLKKPGVAFIIASKLNKDLCEDIRCHSTKTKRGHFSGQVR
jgi:hypothetical protein